jgi:hypothetical protein
VLFHLSYIPFPFVVVVLLVTITRDLWRWKVNTFTLGRSPGFTLLAIFSAAGLTLVSFVEVYFVYSFISSFLSMRLLHVVTLGPGDRIATLEALKAEFQRDALNTTASGLLVVDVYTSIPREKPVGRLKNSEAKELRSSDLKYPRHQHHAYLTTNLARALGSNSTHNNSLLPLPLLRKQDLHLKPLAPNRPITLPRWEHTLCNAPPSSRTHASSRPPKRIQHRQLEQPEPRKQRSHRSRWQRSQLHGRCNNR